jgi:imidazolonepropionase-like amidohydrolase
VAVLPGLWDCDGHLLGWRAQDYIRLTLEPPARRAARCVADLRAALDAGVTSLREVGARPAARAYGNRTGRYCVNHCTEVHAGGVPECDDGLIWWQ